MKKNLFTPMVCSVLCLLGLALSDAKAQVTVHNPTFTTTNQSWYKPGTLPSQLKNYLLDGAVKGFTDQSIGSSSAIALVAKMGLDIDLYTDVRLPAEGKVNVNFPARIGYTYPADRSYGCGEEIPIATTCSINAGYNLNSTPPIMDVQFGVRAKAGIYAAVESFFGDATILNQPAGFSSANGGNYESKMTGGEQSLLQYNSGSGVGIASEGWMASLPVTIPFPVSFPTKLNGNFSPAFEPNPNDLITGKIISESVTRKFMDLDYDPIQYSSFITGITLKRSLPIPSVGNFSYTFLSVPVHFDVFQTQKLKFDPEVNIQMQLNRTYNYRVRDENNVIVQTGTGSMVTMKAGHTLLVTVPSDNQPIAVTPTYKLDNEFTTEVQYTTNTSFSIEMFAASASTGSIEICDPTGILDFFGLEEYECNTFGPYSVGFGPIVNIPVQIKNVVSNLYPETTFSMGGFQDIPGATITLQPDNQPPVANFTHPTFELNANGQVTVNAISQVTSGYSDADGGVVTIVNQPSTTYTCADIGERVYTFILTDSRCNTKTYDAPVTIVDRIPPVITCPSNKTVVPATAVACTAVVNSINSVVTDNCSTVQTYALTGTTTATGSNNATGLTFNSGLTTVTYNVTDPGGNMRSCSFVVTVSTCASGRIIWKQDNSTGVKTTIVNVSGDFNAQSTTGADGVYGSILTGGYNFTIVPSKNITKLNGVNAQDVFRMQLHLSGNLITDPWQLIACDANSNGVINPLDLSIIQNSILGNPQALAQMVKSWRFIPKSYTMTNPPWGFPESIVLSNVVGRQADLDFYGVKVGDVVSLYANPANLAPEPAFVLTTKDQALQVADELEVNMQASQTEGLTAMQFGLHFDPERLELVAIETQSALPMSEDNFGLYGQSAGNINFLWAGTESIDVPESAPVFRLKFKVLASGGKLSEALQLTDETLPARAFKGNTAEAEVLLHYFGATGGTSETGTTGVDETDSPGLYEHRLQLLQNQPNPFNSRTQIGFELPEACAAQLRIMDASGRVIALRNKQYPAGLHREVFELEGVSGVLYYELTTPFGVLAKKMVLVRD